MPHLRIVVRSHLPVQFRQLPLPFGIPVAPYVYREHRWSSTMAERVEWCAQSWPFYAHGATAMAWGAAHGVADLLSKAARERRGDRKPAQHARCGK